MLTFILPLLDFFWFVYPSSLEDLFTNLFMSFAFTILMPFLDVYFL